jgi:hypothetical protein
MANAHFLHQYRKHGFQEVEGWCLPEMFDVMELLDTVDENREGGILEIGVHHGKFYMMLNAVVNGFDSYAVDVFERQELNVDDSGKGDREIFMANLKQYDRWLGENTVIVSGDSLDAEVQKQLPGKFRFVSIDGGHSAKHTLSDLCLAAKLVAHSGVVFLDDIQNPNWPGVYEGWKEFADTGGSLCPVGLAPNKLLLVKPEAADLYCNFLKPDFLFADYDVASLS